jgi:ribosomal peptide maturation radical SAM protein 1
MSRVLLITMPFSDPCTPALGISLLRAELKQAGIPCDIRYLKLEFAARIGMKLYRRVSDAFPSLMIGEWIFAQHMFGSQIPASQAYVDQILDKYCTAHSRSSQGDIAKEIFSIQSQVEPFLNASMESIPWEIYSLIGFTSSFAQHLASLALAQLIKQAYPEKVIVFGGSNCEDVMGVELHRQFSFVDYVCSGKSDRLFPELVKRLEAGQSVSDLQGLIYRKNGETVVNGRYAAPILDLDELPYPDFDDYFTQLEECGVDIKPDELHIPIETSRGCWWGSKSQCMFCGLNTNALAFRSKSSQRVLQEFAYLAQRYPDINTINVADNILDMGYFQDVIPGLIEMGLNKTIIYEVKSNLNKEQIMKLSQAGIRSVQPGIENLDSEILRLMHKGCTAVQNIQLMKWARQFGVYLVWNLLVGFPGEDLGAYQRMEKIIPSLTHLQPPGKGVSRMRLDRFSPYFNNPEAYGIVNVRPGAAYRYVYPFGKEVLERLVYYFDFDYADGRDLTPYVKSLNEIVKQWHNLVNESENVKPPALNSLENKGRLRLYDTRPGACQSEFVLEGMTKAIYDFCDRGQTFASILSYLEESEAPYSSQVNPTSVQAELDALIEKRYMLFIDNRYLSLAVPMEYIASDFFDNFLASVNKNEPEPIEHETDEKLLSGVKAC